MDRLEELREKDELGTITLEELDELLKLEEMDDDVGMHQTAWGWM